MLGMVRGIRAFCGAARAAILRPPVPPFPGAFRQLLFHQVFSTNHKCVYRFTFETTVSSTHIRTLSSLIMSLMLAAIQCSIVDFNGVLAYNFDHPVGAKQDPTFVHKKCFNTFGEPSGLALTTSQRISMVEGYSFDGRATLSLTALALPVDDNIPASCATAGTLKPEFDLYYNLESCGLATVTERLKVCAAICTHVHSCVAGELSPSGADLTRCALHGGDGFESVGQLPGACRERPCRTRLTASCALLHTIRRRTHTHTLLRKRPCCAVQRSFRTRRTPAARRAT